MNAPGPQPGPGPASVAAALDGGPIPGRDAVADHTWCCEHPEPWHYFHPLALARLLSGLARVSEVDPVETAWSMRIASWAAGEEADSVLAQLEVDADLTPKLRAAAAGLRRRVQPDSTLAAAPELAPACGCDTGAERDPASATAAIPELLSDLRSARDPVLRDALVHTLLRLAPDAPADMRSSVLIELVAAEQPAAEALWQRWFHGDAGSSLSDGGRAHLALALAGCGQSWARLASARVVAHLTRGLSAYEVYELTRALDRAPAAGEAERRAVRQVITAAPWWAPAAASDPAVALVVAAALGLPGVERDFRRAARPGVFSSGIWRRTEGRRAVAEAAGYLPGAVAARRIAKWLDDPGLGVRREAARSLWRLDQPDMLQAHLRHSVLPGKALFDIEGVDVIRYAVDALVRHRPPRAEQTLAAMLRNESLHIHDLADRVALALVFLDDPHALLPHPQTQIPWAVHAALTPVPLARWEIMRDPVAQVAQYLARHWDRPDLRAGAEPPLSHLQRVHLQRRMLAACG